MDIDGKNCGRETDEGQDHSVLNLFWAFVRRFTLHPLTGEMLRSMSKEVGLGGMLDLSISLSSHSRSLLSRSSSSFSLE